MIRLPHRNVLAADMIHRLRPMMNSSSGIRLPDISRNLRTEDQRTLNSHFQDNILRFLTTYPQYFRVEVEKGMVSAVGTPVQFTLNEDSVMKVMQDYVPPTGYMDYKQLTTLLYDSPIAAIDTIVEASNAILSAYQILEYNSGNDVIIADKEWWMNGGAEYCNKVEHKSIVRGYHALPILYNAIPDYWIPLVEVCKRLKGDDQKTVGVLGVTRSHPLFPPSLLQYVEDGSRVLVRRTPGGSQLPPCKVFYPGFDIPNDMVFKLAFSMGKIPCTAKEVNRKLFPSARAFFLDENCSFDMKTVVSFYPTLMECHSDNSGDWFRCILENEEYNKFFLKETQLPTTEERFMALFEDPNNHQLIQQLNGFAAQSVPPSRALKQKKKRDKDSPALSDVEMVDIVTAAIPGDSQIAVQDLYNKIQQTLPPEKFAMFRNGVTNRHVGFTKFLQKMRSHFIFDEVLQYNARLNYSQYIGVVSLVDAAVGPPPENNPFLEEEALMKEISNLLKDRGGSCTLRLLKGIIHFKAREAIDALGGIKSVLGSRPDLFDMSVGQEDSVRLKQ
eukprot:PhF_6_TR15680/c0_g1_i1/m.24381